MTTARTGPRLVTDKSPTSWAWRFKADEEAVDVEARTVEGLSNTWTLDLGGDVVERGAFRRSLGRWRKSGHIIPLLDSHNAWGSVSSVVGKLLEAKETKDGLWSKFELVDDPTGQMVMDRIVGGFVDGLSIGYRPTKIRTPTDAERRGGVWRFLEEVEVREVSVVVFPMNEGSRLDASTVKQASELIDRADELLRYSDPTDEEKTELVKLHEQIGALLESAASVEPITDLVPDSPERIAQQAKLRELQLRSLTPRA